MDRDEREDDGGAEGLPPLVVRQAIADVLADRLPLAADAVLAGTLLAEQLYVLEEGVQRLLRAGHGPDVVAALERRLVGLASARPGVDLVAPSAEFLAGLDRHAGHEPTEGEPVEAAPTESEPAAATVAPDAPRPTVGGCPTPPRALRGRTGHGTGRGSSVDAPVRWSRAP
jgi:hypothetical protein